LQDWGDDKVRTWQTGRPGTTAEQERLSTAGLLFGIREDLPLRE